MNRKSDLAQMLTMVHNAVLHGDQGLKEVLTENFEKVDDSNRTAQAATSRAVTDGLARVTDEINRMRKDLQNATRSNVGDAFMSKTDEVTRLLRAELTELRTFLDRLSAPALPERASAVPCATAAENDASDPRTVYRPAIPTQRDTDYETPASGSLPCAGPLPGKESGPGSAAAGTAAVQKDPDAGSTGEQASEATPEAFLPEAARQTVRELLAADIAPLIEQLTAPSGSAVGVSQDGDSAERLRETVREEVREAVQQAKDEIVAALEETRSGLASLHQGLADLHEAIGQMQARPTGAVEVSADHTALLRTAARISSADLRCHRDTWEFLTAHAASHPHFRVPPRVTDEPDERVFAPLSGRSLIALLISLHAVTSTASDGSGDRELAVTLYERIEQCLIHLSPGDGDRVTITLDDRVTRDHTGGIAQDGEDQGRND
ncbi:hypothetical protein AB0N23_22845 [Streptomyces sp. NPDC052644]